MKKSDLEIEKEITKLKAELQTHIIKGQEWEKKIEQRKRLFLRNIKASCTK